MALNPSNSSSLDQLALKGLTVCDVQMTEWSYQMFLFFVAHLIAMSSTVYNPFVYAWFNDTFRAQFQKVVPCCRFGRYVVTDDGSRRRIDTHPSPSRFATGGWSSTDADTNHALSLSIDGSGRQMLPATTVGPPIELAEVTSTLNAENRQA